MTQKVKISNPNSVRGMMVAELVQHPKLYHVVAHNAEFTEFYHVGSGTLHRFYEKLGPWHKWNPRTRRYEPQVAPNVWTKANEHQAEGRFVRFEDQGNGRLERI
ncbi:hypothetical protein EHM76_04435 [bacterium]|nr:MAG: hypothetical protein EHM76_04435 [bacterium]